MRMREVEDNNNINIEENQMETEKFVVVGYALTSKKTKSFLQPKFESLARSKGILFVAIDQSKPLSDQGPFDVVLHKLSGSKWRRILENACSFLRHESWLGKCVRSLKLPASENLTLSWTD